MTKLKTSFAFIMVCFLATQTALAQERYSKVKIQAPTNKQQRAELIGLLEIDHFDMHDGAIIAEISQTELTRLNQSGARYEILVPDVATHVQELNRRFYEERASGRVALEQPGNSVLNLIQTPAAFQVWGTFGGFYSFAQMNTAMNNLVAAYPGLAQKTSLGLSVEGRNIWCIKISDNVTTDESNEPEVLYIGVQHAREAIGGSSMIFFMQYLCENYATDPRIQALVNNREIFIIPCMNPDGWEYNRIDEPNGGGGWRKNRRNNGDGTFGVDLNRNWGVDWAQCGGASPSCGSGSTSSDVYWGPSAFSEPETQAIRAFVLTRQFVSCNDQHAFGPYYSLPFGRPSLHTGPDTLTLAQQQYYNYIPALMGKYNGMRAGNSIQSVGYEVAGGVKDWMLKGEIGTGTKGVVHGFTGEGGAGGGTGGTYGSFWPPAAEIEDLCKGMVYQNIQSAFAAGSYVDISDRSDIAVSAISGSFNFRVKRIGLGDQQVVVTLLPLENIQSVGSPVVINSMPNYFDIVDNAISYQLYGNIQPGHRIRFAWRVQTGGQTYYDTVVKFFNPVQMFSDDMETGLVGEEWAVSANWNYGTGIAFGGTRSLTESPGGLYGQNRNDNIRCLTVFDLSDATAAYLTFMVRHRAENFRDKLQVQVSTNGTTWTPIPGRTTVQEPGTLDGSTINGEPSLTGIREDWTPEVFNLSGYLGQPAVRFRFVFTSDANTTGYDFQVDEGFNIDNVKLIKSTTALVILPVKFIGIAGSLKPNQTIRLNWEVDTDSGIDRFIIEKSADGSQFVEVGTTASDIFSFIDISPFPGHNYYRVRAVVTGSHRYYSPIIDVFNKELVSLQVYPNPVKDVLRIKLKVPEAGGLTLQVTDVLGKLVHSLEFNGNGNEQEVTIPVSSWPARSYFVRLLNHRNEVLSVKQLMKN